MLCALHLAKAQPLQTPQRDSLPSRHLSSPAPPCLEGPFPAFPESPLLALNEVRPSTTTGISIDSKFDTLTIELHPHSTSVLSIFSPNEDVNSGILLPDTDAQAGGKAIPKTRHQVDAVHISAHAGTTPTARFAKQASVPKKTYWSRCIAKGSQQVEIFNTTR